MPRTKRQPIKETLFKCSDRVLSKDKGRGSIKGFFDTPINRERIAVVSWDSGYTGASFVSKLTPVRKGAKKT